MLPSLHLRLHQSIERGNLEEVQAWIALQADPNGVCSISTRTPIQTAVVFKRPAIIKYLLSLGAALAHDIIEQLLRSTGHSEYTFGDVVDSLKVLLEAGAQTYHIIDIPKGYLLPVMLAHSDHEKAHIIITQIIRGYGKQKIA